MSVHPTAERFRTRWFRRGAAENQPDAEPARESVAGGPLSVLATAAWLGLLAGLAEVSILVARHTFAASSALGALQTNRHFLWMIPVSQLALFLACGLPLAALAVVRPMLARRAAAFVFVALTAFALLLMIRGLFPIASGILAVGIGCFVARRVEPRAARLRRGKRYTLPVLLAVVAALGAVSYDRFVLQEHRALAALPKPAPSTPNVLLIVLDTVRADRMSLHGYSRDTTPYLAWLARRGVVFREARSAAPWTFPSHASLFTGRWPHELNLGIDRPLDATYPTLAEFLAKHGYATAGFIGNTYFCNSWFGLARGFAHYEDYYEHNVLISPDEAFRCSALGRTVIDLAGSSYNVRPGTANSKDADRVNRDFLRWVSRNSGRPFFAFLNYVDVHDPYMTPPEFDRHFGLKPETAEDIETIRSWHRVDKKAASPVTVAMVRDAYDDCLSYLDAELGRLFDELDRCGVLVNTLVIVTSDHGEGLGEHGLFLHGLSLYRHEVHVPLVVVAPERVGVPAGRVIDAPVSLRDLAATVADRLGLAGESPFPGRSLARFWEPSQGRLTAASEPILSEVTVRTKVSKNPDRAPALRGPMASLTAEGKVYIRDAMGREEVYDLADDPEETNNLAASPAAKEAVNSLRTAIDQLVPQQKGSP